MSSLGEAALDLGHSWAPDHNAPHALGVSPYAINSRDGVRVSTNDAYLEPSRERANLEILGDAHVDRVLFEGERAVGVRFRRAGEWRELRARVVLLCAGAVHSPAILMRSGIGPAGAARGARRSRARRAPRRRAAPGSPARGVRRRPARRSRAAARLPPHERCVRYSSGLCGAGPGDMMMVAMNHLGDSIGRHLRGESAPPSFGLLGVWVNECVSRGTIRLASLDPMVDPIVEENMLDAPSDLARMRDGVRRLIEIVRHPAARAVGTPSGVGLDLDARSDRTPRSTAGC